MDRSADAFEAERPRLISLAYRMLGERSAAEDVAQETWLRWNGADQDSIADPGAWLRTTAARIAIDALRSARARRERYVGPWLPEPLAQSADDDPEAEFALAQEARLALIWACDRLAPEERAAFILKDAFDADYTEISAVLAKAPATCRQIVARARQRVRQAGPRFDADDQEVEDLLARFSFAAATQDRGAILKLLAPDAVAVTDGGGAARAALRPLVGALEIAQVWAAVARKFETPPAARLIRANGAPALAVFDGSEQEMLLTLVPDEAGAIAWIYVMRNPAKLVDARDRVGAVFGS